MEEPFLYTGIATKGVIGDASCMLADAAGMADMTTGFLKRNGDLFIDKKPVPKEWYSKG
jgi:hypothetical protein